jgi:formylglycine-generating enzyme required for sulfatase activity
MLNTPSAPLSPILDDRPAEQDALDFAPYSDTLVGILCNPHTHTPLTVGLFGTWGSGKTSLMRMIKAKIDDAKLPSYHTVWFNAWKYNREDALWRALILRVLESLRIQPLGPMTEQGAEQQQALYQDLDRLEESLYRTVEWEEVGRWTLDWLKALRGTVEGAADIALAFVPGGAGLVKLLKQVTTSVAGDKEQAVADAFRREVKAYRREQLRSLEQFEGEFHRLLSQHIINRKGRLIVFVDDLDRCLPQKTIEVLEAIKLFLDVPGCVFVLGLDQDAIVEAIQTRYHDRIKGRQYLEKVIQLPFMLPPIEAEDMRSFVNSLVPQLPDPRCSEVFAEGLPHNPRQMKRTINIFLLLWHLSRQKLPELIHPVPLAKIVTIQQSQPELYALLREVPLLLRDLENYFHIAAAQLNKLESAGTMHSESSSEPTIPLLPPQLQPFVEQPMLRRLLTLHPADAEDANFRSLSPQSIRPYIYLTRRADADARVSAGVLEPQVVRVPAGNFIMGSTNFPNEGPLHTIYLPDYAIGRYQVTNYEYLAFVQDTGRKPPQHWEGNMYPSGLGDHPVVYVDWSDAVAYSLWLGEKTNKPYRLPSEAEWEKAARGPDGRTWPWGDEWSTSKCNCRENNYNRTTPVGQFSPDSDSPYGIADLAGNVWEWCATLYKPYPYHADDNHENMSAAGERTLRGGCFLTDNKLVRCASRHNLLPNSRDRNIGFRIVVNLF